MKLKNIIALLLSAVLVLSSSVPVFAYEDSVITGQCLELGDNHITGADPDTVSIYYFTPPAWSSYGVYRVTVTGEGARLRSFCGTVGYRYDNTEDTDYDSETNSYSFNVYKSDEKHLIGVTGAEEFDINIRKAGTLQLPVGYSSTYTAFSSVAPYSISEKFNIAPSEGSELKYVDITVPHTVHRDKNGLYHLDNADGPVLYMNMISPPYIDLYTMANIGILRYALFSKGMTGRLVSKRNYSNLYLEYAFYTDPELGILPLQMQLVTLLQEMGKAKGWYDKDLELGDYLFGDMAVDKDSAWMFPLCYFEDPDSVQYRDGSKELPYSLICDDYNGSFCEIKSGNRVFYTLDVTGASQVSAIAFDTKYNGYKGFQIVYGDKTYTPDSEGLVTFKTNEKHNTIEVINSGTRDGIFIFALSSATPESDGSMEAPYVASFGSDNSVVHTLEAGEMMFILADTACNATAEIFALDGNFEYNTDFLAYHNEIYYSPDMESGILSFELFELDNFYLVYNYSEEPLNIYASLKKTDSALPDADGSKDLPYMLYCDPYDFSSYSLAKNESINFKTNYSDGSYVLATAINSDNEQSPDLLASYNGSFYAPNASNVLVFPLEAGCNTFEIQNISNKELFLEIAVVSDISFMTPEGSYEAPAEVTLGQYTAEITEDNAGPIYYSYTSTKNGILSFEIDTENSDEWFYTVTNATTGYTTPHTFSNNGEASCSMGVSKGDTVIIEVSTTDSNRVWLTPEGEVTWSIDVLAPLIGDINLDGYVNSQDSNLLKRILTGNKKVENETLIFECADVDADNSISAMDSNLLKRYLAGIIGEF